MPEADSAVTTPACDWHAAVFEAEATFLRIQESVEILHLIETARASGHPTGPCLALRVVESLRREIGLLREELWLRSDPAPKSN